MFAGDESLMNNSEKTNTSPNDSMKIQEAATTNTVSESCSYNIYDYSNVFFQTERISLPREKVVEINSIHSSPSHGFREDSEEIHERADCKSNHSEEHVGCQHFTLKPGNLCPEKISKDYQEQIHGSCLPPKFDPNVDYYKEYWKIYLQNENLLSDIE